MKNKGVATLGGIEFFLIDDTGITSEHRLIEYSYPQRNEYSIESLGAGVPQYSISGVLVGKLYKNLEAIKKIFNDVSALELSHSALGRNMVRIKYYSVNQSAQELDCAYISFNYVIDNSVGITEYTINKQVKLADYIKDAVSAMNNTIDNTLKPLSINSALEFVDDAVETLDVITDAVRGLFDTSKLSPIYGRVLATKGAINQLIQSPNKLVNDVTDCITAIVNTLTPGDAITALNRLRSTKLNDTTPQQQLIKRALLITAVNAEARLYIASATNPNSTQLIESFSDAKLAENKITQLFEEQIYAASDERLYSVVTALRTLSNYTATTLNELSVSTAGSSTVDILQPIPALAFVYEQQGNILNINRFIRRNAIVNPNFITGKLEVING